MITCTHPVRQIIGDVLQTPPMPFIKQTMDEVEIQGNESKYDTRKLNSYPSKVTMPVFSA